MSGGSSSIAHFDLTLSRIVDHLRCDSFKLAAYFFPISICKYYRAIVYSP